MNRKEAAELLPIIKAFSEGKTIEYRSKGFNEDWKKVTQIPELSFKSFDYRIKPKPRYRPFANAEECWQEMQKHQPFGWIKRNGYWYNIISTDITNVKIIDTRGAIVTLRFDDLLSHYSFADGTPFGVKVEE